MRIKNTWLTYQVIRYATIAVLSCCAAQNSTVNSTMEQVASSHARQRNWQLEHQYRPRPEMFTRAI